MPASYPTRISVLCRWKENQPVGGAFFSYYVKIASNFHIVACGSHEQSAALSALRKRYPISSVVHMEGVNASQSTAYFSTQLSRAVGSWAYLVDSDEFVDLPFLSVMETVWELEASGATSLPAVVLKYSASTRWLEEPTLIPAAAVKFPLFHVKPETVLGPRGVAPSELGGIKTALQGVIHCVPMSNQVDETGSAEGCLFPVVHRASLFSHGLLRCVKSEPSLSVV